MESQSKHRTLGERKPSVSSLLGIMESGLGRAEELRFRNPFGKGDQNALGGRLLAGMDPLGDGSLFNREGMTWKKV
jgi:hypothetical protein